LQPIQFIAFSRSRPLQLHGYLSSLYAQWQGESRDLRVGVIVRADEPYRAAYDWVRGEFSQVNWIDESDFASDLDGLIDDKVPFTSFGCDDVVFVAPLSHGAIVGAFDCTPQIIGMSLRLGRNVTRDMFAVSLPQPVFTHATENRLVWDVSQGHSLGDWAYPWEVLGTVYPTAFVREVVDKVGAPSPSQLEARGATVWRKHTSLRHMASFATSRLVVPTVNVIQQEFPGNGIRGKQALSPEFLVECWLNGLRLDTDALVGLTPPSWRVADFPLRRLAA
jgi:hypothetical protein